MWITSCFLFFTISHYSWWDFLFRCESLYCLLLYDRVYSFGVGYYNYSFLTAIMLTTFCPDTLLTLVFMSQYNCVDDVLLSVCC